MDTYINDAERNIFKNHQFKDKEETPVDKLLTVDDVAHFAGLAPETVGYHIRVGRLRAYKLGSQWVVQIDDAFDWIKGREYR
tara:strand:+ start:60 stop:305 length:246 start_codon:yes stop_codon:yes gene_type:complete